MYNFNNLEQNFKTMKKILRELFTKPSFWYLNVFFNSEYLNNNVIKNFNVITIQSVVTS